MDKDSKTPITNRSWFRILLVVASFTPAYSEIQYNPAYTPQVVALVLGNPAIVSVKWLLPVAKLLLLFMVTTPLWMKRSSGRLLMGYYGVLLLVVGLFQNMAHTTSYGFVWLVGNTLTIWVVAFFCLVDFATNRTSINRTDFRKGRWWLIPLMCLSLLMPYSIDATGVIRPDFSINMLLNESGVTYCMITPVVLGTLLLFPGRVYKPTLSVISWVGLIFAFLNMFTWFVSNPQSWWMGILHLPLLVTSIVGLIVSRKKYMNN